MPSNSDSFKLGSVVLYDFGPPAQDRADEGILREKHYAVVAQTTTLSASSTYETLVLVGLTSTKPKRMMGWVEVPATPRNGLHHTSYLDAKKLYTIRKDRVERWVGELEPTKIWEMKQILKQLFELDS